MKFLLLTDFHITLIGLGVIAFVVVLIIILKKWEEKRATSFWEKRN